MHARLSIGLAVLGLIVAEFATLPAAAGGGEGTREDYFESRDTTLPRLSVRFDRVIYGLSLTGGKYKVFPVMIENRSGEARLVLSRQNDAFTIITHHHDEVPGILDLASADPALWDELDAELRQALLYPGALEPSETRIFYVLAPAAQITEIPESFVFLIKSLERSVKLERPPVTKN
jgi:hypothetical protein